MIEWLEVDPGRVVLASAGPATLHRIQARSSDPFARPMCSPGSWGTTQALLEGVIALAARDARTDARSQHSLARSAEPLTPERWAQRLAGYFHTTSATRRLLPRVLAAFERQNRLELVKWARDKIRDEAGHDELAFRDLTELGYSARKTVERVFPARARAWVELFERLAADPWPVGCLGYAHALERLAQARPAHYVERLERQLQPHLPAGVMVTRCLRVHSALGSDTDHARANVDVICRLPADERRAIALACWHAARIAFDWRLAPDDGPSSSLLRAPPPTAATIAALEHCSG